MPNAVAGNTRRNAAHRIQTLKAVAGIPTVSSINCLVSRTGLRRLPLGLPWSEEAAPHGGVSPANSQVTIANGLSPGLLPEVPGAAVLRPQRQTVAGEAGALPHVMPATVRNGTKSCCPSQTRSLGGGTALATGPGSGGTSSGRQRYSGPFCLSASA